MIAQRHQRPELFRRVILDRPVGPTQAQATDQLRGGEASDPIATPDPPAQPVAGRVTLPYVERPLRRREPIEA